MHIDPLEPRRQFAAVGLDPLYGTNGVAKIAITQPVGEKPLATEANAAAFAPSGAGYIQVRERYSLKDDHTDRYLLYRLQADGTFDSAFGTGGRFETKASDESLFFQTLAVSPSGRMVVTDAKRQFHVFDAAGREQYGVSNRLTRTIARLRGSGKNDYDNSTAKVRFSETAVFDDDGRLLIPGEYLAEGKENAVAVFRFTTYGLLDHDFGNVGRAFTRLSNENINYAIDRLAVGRDGQIYFTIDTLPVTPPPAGLSEYYTVGDLSHATFSPDGTRLRSGPLLQPPEPYATKNIGGLGNLDLRPLADGSASQLGYTSPTQRLSVLREDGTVTGTPVPGVLNTPLRITPAGTLRASVNAEPDDRYRPVEGSSDAFVSSSPNSIDAYAVLGDGSLLAAGIDRAAETPTLRVEKFDGTGLASPAAEGTAMLRPATRTLDVRGTGGDDAITVTYANGKLGVRVNGHTLPDGFPLKTFDTLHVSGGGGNDRIRVEIGRQNTAVRLRGDAGDDVLWSDAYQATIDGGSGNDTGTLTPGSGLNPVGVESLRHPAR